MKFNVLQKNIITTEDDGAFYITGVANSGKTDLVGDIITSEALEQICTQATIHNLHWNHNTEEISDMIGTITDANITEGGVEIRARVFDEYKGQISSYLAQGAKFGLSVAGTCEYEPGSDSLIREWNLTEISLVPIPCDQQTMGTVRVSKSFTDALCGIYATKDLEVENMADEAYITEEKCVELINIAFNEKEEELREAILTEIKNEYDPILNVLRERVDALEAADAEEPEETEEEEVVEVVDETEEVTETTEETDDEEDEGKETQKEDDPATSPEETEEETEDEDDDGEEEDDDKKSLEETIDDLLSKRLEELRQTPQFEYDNNKHVEEEVETKKAYTPHELAHKVLSGN